MQVAYSNWGNVMRQEHRGNIGDMLLSAARDNRDMPARGPLLVLRPQQAAERLYAGIKRACNLSGKKPLSCIPYLERDPSSVGRIVIQSVMGISSEDSAQEFAFRQVGVRCIDEIAGVAALGKMYLTDRATGKEY